LPFQPYEYLKPYIPHHSDLAYTIYQFLYFYTYYADFFSCDIVPHLEPEGVLPLGISPIVSVNSEEGRLKVVDPLNVANNVGKSSFRVGEVKG
jgi:hypothetical protein